MAAAQEEAEAQSMRWRQGVIEILMFSTLERCFPGFSSVEIEFSIIWDT